ncbi:hypothetical protein A3C57_02895 [Candidatus Nomurabacteria bacterium RIFCSPHIGHO2_02_FULL_33_12]|uniref:Riboflavin transporter n=1 Tax=Candidatus Nomurabacteria bacterium RIFCSPLOWO2_01_FULL_33_17 TaxID=1801764 RepID=A0A1F6WPB0_9BACT|nr:MAG: hypothetical protein A3C57_02895 [Candidatus Nomurabacteria bacterium RIFCSPHIGHO2_02_FULL_33_12]OGI83742.1 MAG: hypothetical protein A2903_02640 [Candidatus Nomurabacteria bacterium RIFCSPLOWO2_01_FULL_33_17]
MQTYQKNWFKFFVGFFICFLIRLIPFRPPNIEPILATAMPFSKNYGKVAGFFFAFTSIFLFDLVTNKIGIWTLVTAVTYGLLGVFAAKYFEKKEMKRTNYVKFAVIGTLAYDALTGLTIGPIFFNQTFLQALTGQIPFTLMHLVGNITLAIILSPLVHKILVSGQTLKVPFIIKVPNSKLV